MRAGIEHTLTHTVLTLRLDYQDSNLEKQDQNLLCYHYTIVQSIIRTTRSDFDDAKIRLFSLPANFFQLFFTKKQNTSIFHYLFFVRRIKPSIFVPCFIICINISSEEINKNER